jgi:hypothetical protein
MSTAVTCNPVPAVPGGEVLLRVALGALLRGFFAGSPWKMTCLDQAPALRSKSYQATTEASVAPGSISWA